MAMMLAIELKQKNVTPGGRLEGNISLILPAGTGIASADLIVFWRTEGRGTTDEAIALSEALPWNGLPAGGQIEHSFSVRVPQIPWTYHGRLIKIHWYVGVYVKPLRGREVGRDVEFVLHPKADYAQG